MADKLGGIAMIKRLMAGLAVVALAGCASPSPLLEIQQVAARGRCAVAKCRKLGARSLERFVALDMLRVVGGFNAEVRQDAVEPTR